MNVGESVKLAIDAWERGELDNAMLHACNAVDGTAKKAHPSIRGSNLRFTTLLRESYDALGPMGLPGIDIEKTRFPMVKVERPKAVGGPDIADIIYGVHRCTHGHGDELPAGFQLIPNAGSQPGYTGLFIETSGKIRLSDRMIFGLLAVAVLSPVNSDQTVPDGYHLTFGRQQVVLEINDWWGRKDDFAAISATEPMPSVTLAFGNCTP